MAQNWIVRYNKTGYQLSLFQANHLPSVTDNRNRRNVLSECDRILIENNFKNLKVTEPRDC